jgi:hypothetical protein
MRSPTWCGQWSTHPRCVWDQRVVNSSSVPQLHQLFNLLGRPGTTSEIPVETAVTFQPITTPTPSVSPRFFCSFPRPACPVFCLRPEYICFCLASVRPCRAIAIGNRRARHSLSDVLRVKQSPDFSAAVALHFSANTSLIKYSS